MARTHEREVGTSHIPSCFLLLKLHYLLQCKKYLESGEEYLIYNASASCLVFFFFPVCGRRLMIIIFLICPSSILFSHQIFLLLPLHQ